MPKTNRVLYLCAGLQSSGTTLVSWCFLQRSDMDGILDANNDIFAEIPAVLQTPYMWVKTTISSFRMAEMVEHYQDMGWTVRPLLVCRDVRDVYSSLRRKRYGINGTTAEDPPLRLRFRRFLADWELFREKGWPILSYEQFVKNPERVLREVCVQLDLPWDDAMQAWPKPASAILETRHGNETFRRNFGANLWDSLKPSQKSLANLTIPNSEWVWLEREFARYNRVNSYPEHASQLAIADDGTCAIPSYGVTRRSHWRMLQKPLRHFRFKTAHLLKDVKDVCLNWIKQRFARSTRTEATHPKVIHYRVDEGVSGKSSAPLSRDADYTGSQPPRMTEVEVVS